MEISFMGTPDFAIPILEKIYRSDNHLSFVVTQPPRPRGRGNVMTPSPVMEWAREHDIKVLTPERISDPDTVKELESRPVDVCVVAAFGQLLPASVLEMPKYGCINVHASLLPKYRGAAPIQWSILNGDSITGVTIMQMAEGLDDGDILLQKSIGIEPDDTAGSLFDKLAELGAEALSEALDALEAGSLEPRPQDDSEATYVKKITKDLGRLDFTRSSSELSDYVRGLSPWPGAFMDYNGKALKIHRAHPVPVGDYPSGAGISAGHTARAEGGEWLIRTKDGYLCLDEVQLPGKKRMTAEAFLRGHRVLVQ